MKDNGIKEPAATVHFDRFGIELYSFWQESKIGKIPANWNLMTLDEIKSKEKKSIISGPFGSNISSKYFVNKSQLSEAIIFHLVWAESLKMMVSFLSQMIKQTN